MSIEKTLETQIIFETLGKNFGNLIMEYMWSPVFRCVQDLVCLECNRSLYLLNGLEYDESIGGWGAMTDGDTLEFVCSSCNNYYLSCEHCNEIIDDVTMEDNIPISEFTGKSGKIYLQKFLGWEGDETDMLRFNTNDKKIINDFKYAYGPPFSNYDWWTQEYKFLKIKDSDIETKPEDYNDMITFYVGDKNYNYVNETRLRTDFNILDDKNIILTTSSSTEHCWKCYTCNEVNKYCGEV
jgi:hypothetical protein